MEKKNIHHLKKVNFVTIILRLKEENHKYDLLL